MESKLAKKSIEQGLKQLAKSSFIVFIIIFLSKFLTYFYRIIIARCFGPEIYGIFSLAVMVVGLFVAISSLGLSQGLLRYISFYRGRKEEKKARYLFRIVLVVLFFSSIISGAILFLTAETIAINLFHSPGLVLFLKIFSFLVPCLIFLDVFLSIIRAFEKISWYSFILNFFQNAAKLVFLGLLILIGIKETSIALSYFLGVLVTCIAAYLFCRYKISQIFLSYNLSSKEKVEIRKEVFSYSWPFIFSGIVASLFYWVDSFFIGYFYGPLEVGFYNAAIPLVALFAIAPEIFMQLFFPLVTKEYSRKRMPVVKELSKQTSKWIFLLNLPLFMIVFLFPGAIINLMFGSAYLPAENALRILSISGFLSGVLGLSTSLISMVGKSKLILYSLIITTLVNIILNYFLVKEYGIDGAAFSTAISLLLFTAILLWQAKKHTHFIPLRRKLINIFFISLIPLGLLIFLKQLIPINILSAILLGIFFILTYILSIYLFRGLDENDYGILRAFILKAKPKKRV